MGRGQSTGKGRGRGADYRRGGDSNYQRKSTLDASVLGLGGGAVPSLGGGTMNLASLLGGGGLQTQITPLAGALGGPSMGFLGASGVPGELAGLCALLGNQQSHNVTLTNLQVVELQRAMAAQREATEKQAAALVQAKIDEKVAEELKKVAPGALHAPSEREKKDGDGDLSSTRSGSSQGARRRAKHAERANDLLTYKEAYEILDNAAVGFHGPRGYSSEDDTRGTKSAHSVLRSSVRRARGRIQTRDKLVEDIVERLQAERDPPHQDISPDKGRKARDPLRRAGTNRGGGRSDIPTTPISLSCTDTEPMPSSCDSAVPLVLLGSREPSLGTKRRVDFTLDGDSEASGSKPLEGRAYGAMKMRIHEAKAKKKEAQDAREARDKAKNGSKGPTNKKRVKKTSPSGSKGSVDQNDKQGRALTKLLAQALEAVEHFEESEYPKRSDCTALAPLAMKLAKVYEHCSLLVRQTELMEGLGSTYSQNYDLRPRRGESLKDWFAKVLYRLEYCDMQFQDVDGVMAILETYE